MTKLSKQSLLILVTGFTFGYLLIIWGFFPYKTFGSLGIPVWSAGFGGSLAQGGFFTYPTHMGYPLGAPIVFGLPFNYVQAIFIKLTGIDFINAYSLAAILFLAISFSGIYWLAKRLNASALVAILSSVLYLSTPFVYRHEGYGPLGFAFALFPTYFVLTWVLLEKVSTNLNVSSMIKVAIGISFIATFAMFMDGYSFIMYALTACAIAFYYAYELRSKGIKCVVLPPILLFLGLGIAVISYRSYVQQTDLYVLYSEDFFRGMSTDLITLLIPTKGAQGLYDWLGLSVPRGINEFYGDGSAFGWNFIGILFIVALAGWFTIQLPQLLKWGLTTVAIAALLLALGPSIKFKSYRTDVDNNAVLTKNYNMPKEAAIVSAPYHGLFTWVPGIKYMRATYRWLLVFKFIVLFFAIGSLAYLYKRKPLLCIVLMACLLIEGAPILSIEKRTVESKHNYNMLQRLKSDVVLPLREYLHAEEVTYFWPDSNDFLVNFIAPILNIHAYNVGGDKNVLLAKQAWPKLLKNRSIYSVNNFPEITQLLFASDQVDAVIVPFFNMLIAAHIWPPKPDEINEKRQRFDAIKEKFGDSIRIAETDYFAILRPNTNSAGYITAGISVGETFKLNNQGRNSYILDSGWSWSGSSGTWSEASTALIVLPLAKPFTAKQTVIADVFAYTRPEHPQQIVDVYVNGQYVDHWIFNYHEVYFPRKIPVLIDQATPEITSLKIEFIIQQPISPEELGVSRDKRKLGIGIRSISLVVD